MNNVLENSVMCVCKHCGQKMVGYAGDDECSDCAFDGVLGRAREAAAKAVEESHFQRTGEQKSCGEILRRILRM